MDSIAELTGASRSSIEKLMESKSRNDVEALCDWSAISVASFNKYISESIDKNDPLLPLVLETILLKVPEDENKTHKELREQAIYNLTQAYAKTKRYADVISLSHNIRAFIERLPKARATKVVRTMIDKMSEVYENSVLTKASLEEINALRDCCERLCNDTLNWAVATQRQFLVQRVKMKICALLVVSKQYLNAIDACREILHELKMLDDKAMLLELYMIETKAYRGLKNTPRAKSSLTSALTNANAIYCPPAVMSELDLLSGLVNLDENDPKTAYSYFFESFENSVSLNNSVLLTRLLKYMLFSKLLIGDVSGITSLVTMKQFIAYRNTTSVQSMLASADAYKEKSLEKFHIVKEKYHNELVEDEVIADKLEELYTEILEQNIIKILEPYSCVELSRVAALLHLEERVVSQRIARMILDKKLRGIIDQDSQTITLLEEDEIDSTFDDGLSLITKMEEIVEKLTAKQEEAMKA